MNNKSIEKEWGLDYLRFILVWMVFLFHAWGNGIDFRSANSIVGNYAISMEGFFVLSGFLTALNSDGKDTIIKGG